MAEPPPVTGHLVSRAALNARLASTRDRPGVRVVVSAPFGFGKTHVLRLLVEERDARWCSISSSTTVPDVAAMLGFSAEVTTPSDVIEGLKQQGVEFVVVDDIHLAQPDVTDFVESVIADRGPNISCAVATEERPVDDLIVERASGLVDLIDPRDLRFRLADVESLLELESHPSRWAQPLYDRTDGWPAAIRLALAHLDRDTLSGEFDADLRQLAQVTLLAGLDQEAERALARLSLLDQLAPDVVAELAGPNADAVDRLRQRWLLWSAGSGDAIPAPIRHLARTTAPRVLGDEFQPAAALAGRLAGEHGDEPAAISSFLAAGEWDEAMRLIVRHADGAQQHGDAELVEPWVAALPTDLQADPIVGAIQTWNRVLRSDHTGLSDRLDALRDSGDPRLELEAEVLSAWVWRFTGDYAAVCASAEHVEVLMSACPPNHPLGPTADAFGVFVLQHGASLLETGDDHRATAVLQRGQDLDTSTQHPIRSRAPGLLARLAFEQGLIVEAERLATLGLGHLAPVMNARARNEARLVAAELTLERGAPRSAAEQVEACFRDGFDPGWPVTLARSWLALGRCAAALNDLGRAEEAFEQARAAVTSRSAAVRVRALIAIEESRLALSVGDAGRCLGWVSEAAAFGAHPIQVAAHRARAEMVDGRRVDADGLRGDLQSTQQLSPRLQLDSALTIARALAAADRTDAAILTVSHAAADAERQGLVHTLASDGPATTALLRELARGAAMDELPVRPSPAFLDRILASAGSGGATADTIPALTGREGDVAELLRRGLRADQIAGELFISVNTVKTHRRNVYRKLGVQSRGELQQRLATQG